MEDGTVKIIFVKFIENDSIILIKNLSGALEKKPSKKVIMGSLNDFLILKIFEGKRKAIRDDVFSSNI